MKFFRTLVFIAFFSLAHRGSVSAMQQYIQSAAMAEHQQELDQLGTLEAERQKEMQLAIEDSQAQKWEDSMKHLQAAREIGRQIHAYERALGL